MTVTDVATAVGIKASVPPIGAGVEEGAGNILHVFGADVASPVVDVSVLGVSQVAPEATFAHPRAAVFLWARLLDARGANKNAAAGNVLWLGEIRLKLAIPNRRKRQSETRSVGPANRINLVVLVIEHRGHAKLAHVAGAFGGAALIACARQRRQQQTGEDRNDGDNDEQFNQSKTSSSAIVL